MRAPRAIIDTVLGMAALVWMLVRTRTGRGAAYWRWRRETALGPGPGPALTGRVRALLAYARWIVRMRRMG